MGYPWIADLRVVLDDDESTAGAQVGCQPANDLDLLARIDEVERVRRDKPVERWKAERLPEVGDVTVEVDSGESDRHRARLIAQRRGIPIDRHDRRPGPEDLGEGEREGAAPRTDVRPRSAA